MEYLYDHSPNAYQQNSSVVRAVVGSVCVLSMVGSVFVIISYWCIKDLQPEDKSSSLMWKLKMNGDLLARQILINLSLMDFGVGLANLVGIIVVYFKGYYYVEVDKKDGPDTILRNNTNKMVIIDGLCKSQAFFALFCTLASIFWTITLALFMYLLVMSKWTPARKYFYPIAYSSYAISLFISIWLISTDRLGYAPYSSSGWCGLIISHSDYFVVIIGYDIWIYLGVIVCSTVYSAIYLHLLVNGEEQRKKDRSYWNTALDKLGKRLVFIPALYVFLRIWSCAATILFTYVGVNFKSLSPQLQVTVILLTGIGDSGQGAANGLLFVLFTKVFWRQCAAIFCPCYCKKTCSADFNDGLLIQTPSRTST